MSGITAQLLHLLTERLLYNLYCFYQVICVWAHHWLVVCCSKNCLLCTSIREENEEIEADNT